MIPVRHSGPPLGSHDCVFKECVPSTHDVWGDGLMWVMERVSDGHQIIRTTKPEATPRNICGKFIAMLSGKPLEIGADFDPEAFVGKRYTCEVEPDDEGKPKLMRFKAVGSLQTAAADDDSTPF